MSGAGAGAHAGTRHARRGPSRGPRAAVRRGRGEAASWHTGQLACGAARRADGLVDGGADVEWKVDEYLNPIM
ncbi:hypothetical protein N7461_002595 [Penicillium sp. DV-2018c]|nr:hypothetical protein N7461_002595 [Penicillium sp. DV-2018c]